MSVESKEGGSREVRWQVEDAVWQVARAEEAVVLCRERVELRFAPGELAPLLESLRSLVRRKPASAGRSWTCDADSALALAFEAGDTVTELAARFERSRGAITARLVKLGKIADRGQRRWPLP